uniref:Uncharacterized protein n=1 Tax=Rhodosorus marinus TaxID=101924 RepID=A0A6T6LU89_9RHOD|mmetsp:Transcript_14963/g.22025  ORF Transcript_14963/g.22025 Transcript_14963/m.22025 type:complete len:193 (+) Transcript_14963:66-644(+)
MILALSLGSWTLVKVESQIGVVSYHRPHVGYRIECRNTAGVWVGRNSLLTRFKPVKNSKLTRVDRRSARVVSGSEGYDLALLDVDIVQNSWFTVSDTLPSAGALLTASAAVRGSGVQTKFGTSFLGIHNEGGRYRFDATAPSYLDPEEQFGIVVDVRKRRDYFTQDLRPTLMAPRRNFAGRKSPCRHCMRLC